jgi:hypothetical protein
MILVKSSDVRVWLVVFGTLLSTSFVEGCQRVPDKYRSFLALTSQQQHEQMKNLSTTEQIDHYLAAMRYVHPPEVSLSQDIAARGKEAVPFILKRLKEEKDEGTQVHLMYILQVMNACCYRLKNDDEVIESLKQATKSMKGDEGRRRGEETLKFILDDETPELEKTLDSINKGLG